MQTDAEIITRVCRECEIAYKKNNNNVSNKISIFKENKAIKTTIKFPFIRRDTYKGHSIKTVNKIMMHSYSQGLTNLSDLANQQRKSIY